jgi:hypothetical protein
MRLLPLLADILWQTFFGREAVTVGRGGCVARGRAEWNSWTRPSLGASISQRTRLYTAGEHTLHCNIMRNEHGNLQKVQSEPNKIGLLRRAHALSSSRLVWRDGGLCGRYRVASARRRRVHAGSRDGRLYRGVGAVGQGHRSHASGSRSPCCFAGSRGTDWTIGRGTRRNAPGRAIGWLASRVSMTFSGSGATGSRGTHKAVVEALT